MLTHLARGRGGRAPSTDEDAMGRALPLMVLAALIAASCRQAPPSARRCLTPPPAQGEVLARVGDVAITDGQLQKFAGLGQLGRTTPNYADVLGKIEDRVRFELLAHAAADRGLASDPEVIEAARQAMVRKLLADEMGTAKLGAAIAEAELQRYYARHQNNFCQPEKRRYTLLTFGNDATGRTQAEAFVQRWRSVADDARGLAAALQVRLPVAGKKPRRRVRAPLRWQEQPFADRATVARLHGEAIAEAVFAGPPWTMPPLVETVRGPVAVRVVARRGAMVRSFAEARADIVEQLVRQRRAASFGRYLDEIRATYPIAIYEDKARAWLAQARERPAAGGYVDTASHLPLADDADAAAGAAAPADEEEAFFPSQDGPDAPAATGTGSTETTESTGTAGTTGSTTSLPLGVDTSGVDTDLSTTYPVAPPDAPPQAPAAPKGRKR